MRKIIKKNNPSLEKTLLVDGNYLLKKSFLGAKNQYTTNFGHIGGLFNFFLTLRTVTEKVRPTKIIIFWDDENGGKGRYLIDSRYKSNRKHKKWYSKTVLSEKEIKTIEDSEKSFLKQKIRVCQYLEEMFIRQCTYENTEADDLIAFYCKRFFKKENIVIYTNDVDLCQLLYFDNVKVYIENNKREIGRNTFELFYPYHYLNVTTIKTFIGDTADNIKGIKGLGLKTILKYFPELKKEYVDVETLYQKAVVLREELKEKKKEYVWLENLYYGIDQDDKKTGKKVLENNYKIIDLIHKPFITKSGKEEVELIGEATLDDLNDRGSKNLLKLMREDGFTTLWTSDISTFFKPFYPTINNEKNKI